MAASRVYILNFGNLTAKFITGMLVSLITQLDLVFRVHRLVILRLVRQVIYWGYGGIGYIHYYKFYLTGVCLLVFRLFLYLEKEL